MDRGVADIFQAFWEVHNVVAVIVNELVVGQGLVGRRIEGVAFPKNLPRSVDAPKHCVRVGARKIYGGIGFAVPKESVDSKKPGLS